MLVIVTYFHGPSENIASAAHRRHDGTASATRDGVRRRPVYTRDAQAAEPFKEERIGGVGITPIHIPSTLSEFRAPLGFLDLWFEHVPVEILKTPIG
jgi:hypothetical protein